MWPQDTSPKKGERKKVDGYLLWTKKGRLFFLTPTDKNFKTRIEPKKEQKLSEALHMTWTPSWTKHLCTP